MLLFCTRMTTGRLAFGTQRRMSWRISATPQTVFPAELATGPSSAAIAEIRADLRLGIVQETAGQVRWG